ncbi:alpha/beta fold hydrolase [Streptomyces sp. NPDC056337]|uniref:alpha/beta fold hydrolase n=1 Tax=Streptomyces sp. NPDC056337 TaxID=3345787 RepID=UPI0035D6EDE1
MTSNLADILPLTPAQEGLLFHALSATDAPDPYLVQLRFRATTPVDESGLQRALSALLERHASLRACFRYKGLRRPVQLVPKQAHVPWVERDLASLNSVEADREIEKYLAADRRRRFDMTRAPLLRAAVLHRRNQADLIVTIHHILIDGWSIPVMAEELAALYDGRPLPPAAAYRSYLAWLHDQEPTAVQAAWRDALSGYTGPPLLEQRTPAGASEVHVELPGNPMARTSRAAHCTQNTLAQVAWALALASLSNRDDVVFGGVVSGRPASLAGVERMVGLFLNTLPVRVRFRPGETARQLLQRVQGEQLSLVPFHHARLVDIQQDAGRDLFDTLLTFENYPREGLTVVGRLQLTDARDTTHYPLSLAVLVGDTWLLRLSSQGEADTHDLADRLVRALTALTAEGALDAPVHLISRAMRSCGPDVPSSHLTPTRWEELDWLQRSTLPAAAQPPQINARLSGQQRSRTDHERIVCKLFAEILGLPDATVDTDFFTAGGHSLLALKLMSQLEDELGIRLPVGVLFTSPTPADLVDHLERASAQPHNHGLEPVLTLRAGRHPAIFCLHSSLGLGWEYATLLPHLTPDRAVYTLQQPALSDPTASLPETVTQLVDDYAARIRALQPEGPYAFVGHSFGGMLATELAGRFRAEGHTVALTAILDFYPLTPDLAAQQLNDADFKQESLGLLLDAASPSATALPQPLDAAQVFAAVRQPGSLFTGHPTKQLERFLQFRARARHLAQNWIPPLNPGPLLLITAGGDHSAPSTATKTALWQPSTDALDVLELPCTHHRMLTPQTAPQIALTIETALALSLPPENT